MFEYSIIINLVSEAFIDKIIFNLFYLGYGIEPLGRDCIFSRDGSPGVMFAFKVRNVPMDAGSLRTSLIKLLNDNNISYYSIVAMLGQPPMAWDSSNISMVQTENNKNSKKRNLKIDHLKLIKPDNDNK